MIALMNLRQTYAVPTLLVIFLPRFPSSSPLATAQTHVFISAQVSVSEWMRVGQARLLVDCRAGSEATAWRAIARIRENEALGGESADRACRSIGLEL
jgi:hypothetical protein